MIPIEHKQGKRKYKYLVFRLKTDQRLLDFINNELSELGTRPGDYINRLLRERMKRKAKAN